MSALFLFRVKKIVYRTHVVKANVVVFHPFPISCMLSVVPLIKHGVNMARFQVCHPSKVYFDKIYFVLAMYFLSRAYKQWLALRFFLFSTRRSNYNALLPETCLSLSPLTSSNSMTAH